MDGNDGPLYAGHPGGQTDQCVHPKAIAKYDIGPQLPKEPAQADDE